MIKKFKKFQLLESWHDNDILDDLIEEFDYKYIDNFYDKYNYEDYSEVVYMSPSLIWDNIDDKKFVENWKKDDLNSREFSELDEDDLRRYLKDNLGEYKKESILKTYLKNNEDEDPEDLLEQDDYDNMLDELDQYDLRDIISDHNEEYEAIAFIYGDYYDGYTAKDILDEFYGIDTEFYNKKQDRYSYSSNNTYDDTLKNIKKYLAGYIDEKGVVNDWKNMASSEQKKEFLKENLMNNRQSSKAAQRHLLKKDKTLALKLDKLFKDKDCTENIGSEFKFQDAYIKEYQKRKNSFNKETEPEKYEKKRSKLIEKAVNYIDDNYTLDEKFFTIYPNETWKQQAKKYNL